MNGRFRLASSLWFFFLCLVVTTGVPRAASVGPFHFWSHNFGGVGMVEGYSVAVDASGNVYVTGRFIGTVSFGGASFTSVSTSNDIFLAKYSANGVHLWSQQFGSTGEDQGLAVAVDNTGSVLVTGLFEGTVNFGASSLTSVGVADIFLAKYNTNGVHVWSQRFGNTGTEGGLAIAVDASRNVFMSGRFYGAVSFGGAILTSSGYTGGGFGPTDIFLAKYDANGAHLWSQRFGDSQDHDGANDVAVDPSGNVLITGYFRYSVNFGGSTLTSLSFSTDIFLAKFNPNGIHLWSQRFGGGNNPDSGTGVAADASGNVLLTGYFTDLVNFGGSTLFSVDREMPDAFLAKLNSNGVHQWSQAFPGSNSSPRGIAVDASGNVVISGFFPGTINLGGSLFTSAGSYDAFIAKYNTNGAHQWSRRFGSTSAEIGFDVAVDGSGNALATGYFHLTVDFGGPPLTTLYRDLFLAKYGPDVVQPCIQSIVDVGNDQGKQVKIYFAASPYDEPSAPSEVIRYDAYRRNDPLPALLTAGLSASRRDLLSAGWEFVGSVRAHGEPEYIIGVPTLADSTAEHGVFHSVFFIRAATDTETNFFDSPVDSEYSIDNLSPETPTSFAFHAGILSWDGSKASDFDHFTVYGSDAGEFAAATLIERTTAITLDVAERTFAYYFVTATDYAGNQGRAARVSGQSGGADTPTRYVLSVMSYPNPFNPSTTVSYTVPSRGAVTVAIYDASGARIATLVGGVERAAGAYSVEWNGQADSGAVASSGVYFARVEHHGAVRSKKLVLLK